MESEIERYLVKQVKKCGGQCWKWTGTNGVPDRICLMPDGEVMFVEVKKATGVLSPIQRMVHKKIGAIGHDVKVVWSKEDVDAILNVDKIGDVV